jgi:pyrroloquinoline quinone (PQQ) biosynthesis protein C
MACGSKLSDELEWLRKDIANYIEEEIGHEEWILNDIEALGGDRKAAAQCNAALSTDVMVSYAYDTIARKNPVGFFGMVYVLEKTSSTIATAAAEKIQGALNLPKSAMSYMISHGSLDVGHMQDFERIVNRLATKQDQEAVIDMALAMYELYGNVFKEIPSLSQELSQKTKVKVA